MSLPRSLPDLLRRWRPAPVLFVREALGAQPDAWQAAGLEAVRDHPRVTVRSGHGVGKTSWMAWAILWWITTRFPSRVLATAPTAHQLFDLLWAELGTWRAKLPAELADALELSTTRLALKGAESEAFAVARTARADQPEGLQGFHSPNMLVLVDEASGVADAVLEVLAGAMSTPGARMVLAGNPTRRVGGFFRSHHGGRGVWHRMHVPWAPRPYGDAGYAAAIAEEYGLDSDAYRVRVLGEFPKGDATLFITPDLVETARARPVVLDMGAPVIVGIDLARFGGDRCVVAIRRGMDARTLGWETWRGKDALQTASKIGIVLNDVKPDAVFVDGGSVGGPIVDILRHQKFKVREIAFGGAATESARFKNKRAEMWSAMRDALVRGLVLPEGEIGDGLAEDLIGPEFGFDLQSRLVLESKDDMRRRGLPSTDFADALALTFAEPVARPDLVRMRGAQGTGSGRARSAALAW